MPNDWDIQERWFKDKGFDVRIVTRPKGAVKQLLEWARKNAESELSARVTKTRVPPVLIEIKEQLHLKNLPRWIEAFDISNIGTKFAVGSSVAFKDSKPY